MLALLQAGSYFLDRYSRVIQGEGFNDIAGYTDVTTVIPARLYLAIIAVLVAVLSVALALAGAPGRAAGPRPGRRRLTALGAVTISVA